MALLSVIVDTIRMAQFLKILPDLIILLKLTSRLTLRVRILLSVFVILLMMMQDEALIPIKRLWMMLQTSCS